MLTGHYKTTRSYKSNRTANMRTRNKMLKQTQNEKNVPEIIDGFPFCGSSSVLNGLFTSEGICGMLEAKNHRQVHYMFPFIAALIALIW